MFYVELLKNGSPYDSYDAQLEEVAYQMTETSEAISYDAAFDALERVTQKLIGAPVWWVEDTEVIPGWEIYVKRSSS